METDNLVIYLIAFWSLLSTDWLLHFLLDTKSSKVTNLL